MIRAVLDANVFVTAVLTPPGPAAAALEAWDGTVSRPRLQR